MEENAGRKRTKEGLIRNYWYLCSGWFADNMWNRVLFVSCILGNVAVNYIELYLPKVAVELVTEGAGMRRVIVMIFFWGSLAALTNILHSESHVLIKNQCLKYRHVLEEKVLAKICSTAYSNLEDPGYKKKIDHARELYERWEKDVCECVYSVIYFIEAVLILFISSGLLFALHPGIVAVVAVCSLLQYLVNRYLTIWLKTHRDLWQPLEMKIEYIADKISSFSHAKDLRLYGAERWLLPKYRGLMEDRQRWSGRQMRQETGASSLHSIIMAMRQLVIYGILIYGVIQGRFSVADFVFYIGLAGSLAGNLNWFTRCLRRLQEFVWSIEDYRKMLETPDSVERGGGEVQLPAGDALEICFSHVSYLYPGAREETLKDIDFTVHPGEKIAIVGLNGAGKTTLIKLLCGMYEPTAGEIRINGYPASRWNLESWYQLFSVVFQDVEVLPATIAENVAAQELESLDRNRVRECLEKAGLWEMVEKLPKGMDTRLMKELFRDGVNLSGGETQKLLLARAIYRQARILVLDEPTAALDAIAENRLYLQYHELTRGRTSFFISHRLSSTRFCDRIFVLEDGRITEEGSHEELMEKGGSYYQLFQLQSHYYRNDRTEEFEAGMNPEWEVSSYVSN